MNISFDGTPTEPARSYRIAPQLYLEHFGDEALLLVAEYDRLLTINTAAVELFDQAMSDFAARPVTVSGLASWLARNYDLPVKDCHRKSRELLAFALRNHLLLRSIAT